MTVLVDQAVAIAGVSRRTLYNWMKDGRLPFTFVGLSRRIDVEDLRRVASGADLTAKAFTEQSADEARA